MKKLLALLLAMVMVFALAACGSSDDAETEDTGAETVEDAAEADAEVPTDEEIAAAEGDAAGAGDASGEASGEVASGEAEDMGAQTGNVLDQSVNEHIPTAEDAETYTADENGFVQYLMDCAYYAVGTEDTDDKLGATYYDIVETGMYDMFVSMWGVDDMETFIANGGVPTVDPWTLTAGTGTPDSVPEDAETEG